jgi:hypothetical protein
MKKVCAESWVGESFVHHRDTESQRQQNPQDDSLWLCASVVNDFCYGLSEDHRCGAGGM